MPTDTLQATANGTDNTWTNFGGAARWNSVLPPDDADTTYVLMSAASGNSRQNFVFQDLDAAAKGIQTHTLTKRGRKVSGSTSNVKSSLLLSGSYSDGVADIMTGSYVDYATVDMARPGGGTWVPADINGSQPGFVRGGGGADEDRVTTLKWAVTWQPDNGNFGMFAACHVGLIGGGLLLAEMAKVAAEIWRVTRGKTQVLSSEYEQMYRELREYRFRRYLFLGA